MIPEITEPDDEPDDESEDATENVADDAEQNAAEQDAAEQEMEERVRNVPDATWNELVGGIGGDTPVRVVWTCCPSDFRSVVLITETGDAYTVFTSDRDVADWTVRERSTRGGVIQYRTPSREKARMSVVEAVARGWIGEPPGEGYTAEQTGEPLAKKNVAWTREKTLEDFLDDLLEGEEDLSTKVYRFIQYGVLKIRKREGLSLEETSVRYGFEGGKRCHQYHTNRTTKATSGSRASISLRTGREPSFEDRGEPARAPAGDRDEQQRCRRARSAQ